MAVRGGNGGVPLHRLGKGSSVMARDERCYAVQTFRQN